MADDEFVKGMEVEVCSNDSGLRGAWFVATVLRGKSKKNKILIQYRTLMADEKGTKPLREFVDVLNMRPLPPREIGRGFEVSEEVDASYNDGWWEGVITRVVDGDKYVVYFRPAKEELEFAKEDLRLHREWVNGYWVPPLEDQQQQQQQQKKKEEHQLTPPGQEITQQKQQKNAPSGLEINKEENSSKLPLEFHEGMTVEVSSDEEGFAGAWFTAKIVKAIGENKYEVEYQALQADDETPLLEEVDALHIRPSPPVLPHFGDCFRRLEEVDAFYNEGWWVGVISQVNSGQRYFVYFKETKEELEFGISDLRLHQDWIDGKWVRLSQALKL